MAKTSNPNFMNGVPELLILTLLSREEMYGYQLVKAIKAHTNELISVGEGVVYPALHSLQKRGYLKTNKTTFNGRARIYYRVTKKGQRRKESLQQDWRSVTDAIAEVVSCLLYTSPSPRDPE